MAATTCSHGSFLQGTLPQSQAELDQSGWGLGGRLEGGGQVLSVPSGHRDTRTGRQASSQPPLPVPVTCLCCVTDSAA